MPRKAARRFRVMAFERACRRLISASIIFCVMTFFTFFDLPYIACFLVIRALVPCAL